ncbi:uncharacterized protein LOC116266737 isoform X2 [Nymphaea colorata]|uniref:uncharacterized protein LOC116266737 isoform X2 n=1 Tax=Nymphaea colorata TaxID=210225 RepID=UPI00129DBAEA|nr:uncharacterized protein LOC116266737 isoform X2 [Nymphaea colorata]
MHLGGKTSGLIKHQLSRRPSTFSVSAKNALVEAPVPRPGKEREARALMETVIVTLSSPLLAISPFLLVFFSVRLLFCAALFYRRGLLLYKAIDHDFAVFASLQPSNVEFVTDPWSSAMSVRDGRNRRIIDGEGRNRKIIEERNGSRATFGKSALLLYVPKGKSPAIYFLSPKSLC